jgi:hypothetical protein
MDNSLQMKILEKLVQRAGQVKGNGCGDAYTFFAIPVELAAFKFKIEQQ